MNDVTKPRADGIVALVLIGGLLAGAGITYVAIDGLLGAGALGAGAVTTDARVAGVRVMTYRRRGDSYEVQYTFEVGGRTYSHRDGTGRTELWTPLTQAAYEEARAKGTTPVEYMPDDPWTNQPVHRAGDPIENDVIGLIMGILCMSPAFLWLVAAVRRRRAMT